MPFYSRIIQKLTLYLKDVELDRKQDIIDKQQVIINTYDKGATRNIIEKCCNKHSAEILKLSHSEFCDRVLKRKCIWCILEDEKIR